MDKSKLGKLRQTTTAVQIRKRREMRGQSKQQRNSADIELLADDGRFRRAQSSEWDSRKEDFHTGASGRSCMQTLDKRISTSIDQLDTLRERREAPRFRSSHRFFRETDYNSNDVVIKYKGEQYSKNQYFFGESKPKEQEARKTPFEMFLEDDGPYSRKLFGPVQPPNHQEDASYSRKMFSSSSQQIQSSQTENRDRLVMKNLISRSRDMSSLEEEGEDDLITSNSETKEKENDTKHAVRKGVVWQQRDRLFSRWKERFLVLTRDYLHCFKRGSTRPTEMGEFIFKVKLLQLEGVSLLDKRGYLTVCLCILREGRIYLRSTHGIREWFHAIQNTMYESRRRRKLWIKDNEISAWTQEAREARDDAWKSPRERKQDEHQTSQQSSNQIIPKGINRLSLVSDLLMSEAITSLTQRKDLDDSGHDSGQSSMNTESSSESEKSGQWANRFKDAEVIKKKSGSCNLLDSYTSSRV